MVDDGLDGDLAAAREQHFALLPAMKACFLETNPVPIKDVCGTLGWMEPHVRLPLEPLDERAPVRQRILAAFDEFLDVAV
jgi:4-hydroxy-tetrahydrodipicolinate synthase